MRNRKQKLQPFKVFETEEAWIEELERIVDTVIEKVTARLSELSGNMSETQVGRSESDNAERDENGENGERRFVENKENVEGGELSNITKSEADARVKEVHRQAKEFAKKNSDFDMNEELKNRDFCYLVFKAGVSVEDAYFLIHKDEIMKNRGSQRIAENGVYRNQGISTKLNPEKFSDEDVEKILNRIQNGEQITF